LGLESVASIESGSLFACAPLHPAQQLHFSSYGTRNQLGLDLDLPPPTELVVTTTSLKDRKTHFRSFIYDHSSTNPANLVKIGFVDVQIIDPTKKSLEN